MLINQCNKNKFGQFRCFCFHRKTLTKFKIIGVKVVVERRHSGQQPHDRGALLKVVVVHQTGDLSVENFTILVGETDDVSPLEILAVVEHKVPSRALPHQTCQSLRLKFML